VTERDGTGAADEAGAAAVGRAGGALLRGGAIAGLAAGALGTAVSAAWGMRAAVAFAVGALLAVAALAAGPLLLRASRNASPPAVTAFAVIGYTGVVLVLGGAFLALAPIRWLSADHLASALVTVTVAGLAGQIRAVTRLRVLAFGTRQEPQVTAPSGPGNGDAAQSSPQSTR
jgi:hypothetical protein